MTYTGRFAPSPTGPLHAGSLVAALGSWLDARAHNGQWLVRMEDVDAPRCSPEAGQLILQQLAACGLVSDAPVLWQSTRSAAYAAALQALQSAGHAYPCACSRSDIEAVLATAGHVKPRHGELIYPGTCREGLQGRAARAWRFKTAFSESKPPDASVDRSSIATNSIANALPSVHWHDRRLGHQQQCVETQVGDFILRRADALWAYQLAVVADDAAQGITHVVRGEDLADNTARQILLQRALGLPTPQYLHLPLVLAADGQKLSKQNCAEALVVGLPSAALPALAEAAHTLGLVTSQAPSVTEALTEYTHQWRSHQGATPYNPQP